MSFGKDKRANKQITQGVNQSLALSKPNAFTIGGTGGASIDIMPDGRVTGTGYNPYVDNNIGLYGQRLGEMLQGFNPRDNLDNPYSNALLQLNELDRGKAQRRLSDELNAIGQSGGSFDALTRNRTNRDFDELAIKNRLAGFDSILQAMNALNTGGLQQQQQKLMPIQQALQGFQVNNGLNLQRAQAPLQAGLQQGQNIMQTPSWWDQYMQLTGSVGGAVAGAAGAMKGSP